MTTRPTAPAEFYAIQPCYGIVDDIELWNTTAQIGIYPPRSTLSRQTIEALGYSLPHKLSGGRTPANVEAAR